MAEMPKIVVLTDDELTALIDSSVTKAIAPLSAAIAKINAGTPAAPVETPQKPVETPAAPSTDTVQISLMPNANITGGDWLNGFWVADDTARVSLPTDERVKIGQDSSLGKVKNVEIFGSIMSVTYPGPKLDPAKLAGKSVVFTVPKSEESPVTPSVPANDPATSTGSIRRRYGKIFCNAGMGSGADGDAYIPGIYDTNYSFFTEAEARRIKSYGFDEVRVGFLMGRIIVSAGSGKMYLGKDAKGKNYAATQMYEVGKICKKVGLTIMWDNHVYGTFPCNGSQKKQQLGVGYSYEQFANDWYTLISHLKADPDTWSVTTRFDLCNEPILQTDAVLVKAYQAVIDKCAPISEDKIFVLEGRVYASARNWVQLNPTLHTVTHPRGRQYIEFSAHLYLDPGADGYYDENGNQIIDAQDDKLSDTDIKNGVTFDTIGTSRIQGFADWLKKYDFNGNIGENLVVGSLTNLMKGERKLLEFCIENGINVYLFGVSDWFGNANPHNIEVTTSNSAKVGGNPMFDNTNMLALAKEMAAKAKTLAG
ncbi:cellulase family glycosylhydrolase [Pseudomonas luteola]